MALSHTALWGSSVTVSDTDETISLLIGRGSEIPIAWGACY